MEIRVSQRFGICKPQHAESNGQEGGQRNANSGCGVYKGLGLPKVMSPFWGRIMRIIVYWGLFGVSVGLMG